MNTKNSLIAKDNAENKEIKQVWNDYWRNQNNNSLFARLCALHRKMFISNFVKVCIERYFPKKGIFLETGSGSSESSSRIIKNQRHLIAFDISPVALEKSKKIGHMDEFIEGNIFDTKFKNDSIDGIWNLGVMEHFTEKEIVKILNEFHRILKDDGYAILFWPPKFGSTQIVLSMFERVYNSFSRKKIKFFPDEVSVLKNKRHAKRIISQTKFKLVNTHFNIRDLFTYYVLVLKK